MEQANSYLGNQHSDSPQNKLESRFNQNSPLKNPFKIQHRVTGSKPPSQLASGEHTYRQFKPMRDSLPAIAKKSTGTGTGQSSIQHTLAELQSLEKQKLSIHVKGIAAIGDLKQKKNPMASKFMHIATDSGGEEGESDLFSSSTRY